MRWFTFLKAWAVHRGKQQVSPERAVGNLIVCIRECAWRTFVQPHERDFVEEMVHRAKGWEDKVTVWCGEPGKPEKKGGRCGCFLGAEADDKEAGVTLTYKGRRLVADGKTSEVGEACPRGYWSN